MGRLLLVAIVLILLCKEVSLVFGNIGTAAAYDPQQTPNKCNGNGEDPFPPGNMFAAVNEWLWDNGAACGRRYRLRCLNGINKPCKEATIDVEVVDFCPKSLCPSTLVISIDAFAAISHSIDATVNIEYILI